MPRFIPTLTWYLEMNQEPIVLAGLPEGFFVEEYNEPDMEEYLKIYKAVGEKYNWFDRLLMQPEQLKETLGSQHTRILLLRYENRAEEAPHTLTSQEEIPHPLTSQEIHQTPVSSPGGRLGKVTAGFAELNLSVPGEAEIVYFGICDAFTGRKAGFPFLMKTLEYAWNLPHKPWDENVKRVWLHTCDLDHPAALPLYQKAGFVVYRSEMIMQPVIPGNTNE